MLQVSARTASAGADGVSEKPGEALPTPRFRRSRPGAQPALDIGAGARPVQHEQRASDRWRARDAGGSARGPHAHRRRQGTRRQATGLAQRFGAPCGLVANNDDPFTRNGFDGGSGSAASILSPSTLGAASSPAQSMTGREPLPGSVLHLAGGTDDSGPGLAARDRRIGRHLTSAVRGEAGFEVHHDATRREPGNDNHAEHGVMPRSPIRWQRGASVSGSCPSCPQSLGHTCAKGTWR